MKEAVLALILAASGAAAQTGGGPAAPEVISLSLMEALVAVERSELAGVFAYVPEGQSAVALADFLLRDPSALKLFVKHGERDYKTLGVINHWDKEVYLHLVAATAGGGAPPAVQPPAKKLVARVSRLSLLPSAPLEDILQRRAGAGS